MILTRCRLLDGGEGTALADEPSAIAQVVVSVRPDHVLAIGGDVRGSVSLSRLARTGPGSLADERTVILHLSNRADAEDKSGSAAKGSLRAPSYGLFAVATLPDDGKPDGLLQGTLRS